MHGHSKIIHARKKMPPSLQEEYYKNAKMKNMPDI